MASMSSPAHSLFTGVQIIIVNVKVSHLSLLCGASSAPNGVFIVGPHGGASCSAKNSTILCCSLRILRWRRGVSEVLCVTLLRRQTELPC